ncbi:MAG: DmsC/YnfH family molybdoenzyme membrane anchor subunit, partial [Xanthomonadales bacterium]|nr:DmsC/YnfH family molybdoenzyme membrane anchor subunit [Xanthomonadales bacterium]
MKKRSRRLTYPMAPRQQHNWDWRAATNFILGGAGGGLILCTPLAGFEPLATRIAVLLGLVLVGTGLTSVWFEIGRPWRALNVFLHFSRSWMTREAVSGSLLFISGALALVTLQPALVVLSGLIGLSFLYCQARMLAVNKGIPTWRHPASIPLMTATGLSEGAGLLVCVLAFSSPATGSLALGALVALLTARALAVGVSIAGAVQLVWLLAAASRAGLALRLPRPRLTPGVRRLLK